MARVMSKGTKPERLVAEALRKSGFRFSASTGKTLPGNPDTTLSRIRLYVFVNGCFRHAHGCPRTRMPATNTEYWTRKIERNVQRDAEPARTLYRLSTGVFNSMEYSGATFAVTRIPPDGPSKRLRIVATTHTATT